MFGPSILGDLGYGFACNGYLFIPVITALSGTDIFIEVSDVDTMASGGLYQVSAGALLPSESACMAGKIIYLPAVMR